MANSDGSRRTDTRLAPTSRSIARFHVVATSEPATAPSWTTASTNGYVGAPGRLPQAIHPARAVVGRDIVKQQLESRTLGADQRSIQCMLLVQHRHALPTDGATVAGDYRVAPPARERVLLSGQRTGPSGGLFTEHRSGRDAADPRLLAYRCRAGGSDARAGGNRSRFASAERCDWLRVLTSGPLLAKLHEPIASETFGRVTVGDLPRSSLSQPLRKSALRRQQRLPHDHGGPAESSLYYLRPRSPCTDSRPASSAKSSCSSRPFALRTGNRLAWDGDAEPPRPISKMAPGTPCPASIR